MYHPVHLFHTCSGRIILFHSYHGLHHSLFENVSHVTFCCCIYSWLHYAGCPAKLCTHWKVHWEVLLHWEKKVFLCIIVWKHVSPFLYQAAVLSKPNKRDTVRQPVSVMSNRIHLVLMYIVSMKSLLTQISLMCADVTFLTALFWNSMKPMIDIIYITAFSPKPNLIRHYLFLFNITIWYGHRNCNWRTQDTLI